MASISSLGIGSGLDLNGLLDQLNEAERGKLEPVERQLESQQVRISAYGDLQGALSAFEGAVGRLAEPSLFQSLSANVTGEALQAAAGPEAAPGQYQLEVEHLASAGSLASQRIDVDLDDALTDAEQTLTLAFANAPEGEQGEIAVTVPAGSTLGDIRDAINAREGAGVSASVVNDGEGYRLALMSNETGEAASITGLTFEGGFFAEGMAVSDPGDEVAGVVAQAGRDAALSVNGIAITSPTNQVEGAIQGVTLDLQQAGRATLSVEQDTLAVREAVGGFVEAYNALKGTIGELTAFDADSGRAGELLGDSAVRTIESRLRNDLSGMVGDPAQGELAVLGDLGISLSLDGTLSLDEGELDLAIASDMGAVQRFFTGGEETLGMAGRLSETAGQLLGSNGALTNAIDGAENRIESLNQRYVRMEQGIAQTIERYRVQFGQLDGMIAQMNQTSDYLTQQFATMDAQLGRD
ncbi:flagellar hook-associated protein 2 [Halomonas campaniensis]|uniref:Flagellar hook-associated protein 2 n=1 Tax=Halomonas campaniensis TaxID=213554 RepID=A0A7W5PC91_9GAMM|nr:flagellar filament capping protein FliD [Halomonas campaniensis]MBB3332525.1 flagellar hook-associated protein 2 [Halomonas campaniensis]